jgi:hypothetical protein
VTKQGTLALPFGEAGRIRSTKNIFAYFSYLPHFAY